MYRRMELKYYWCFSILFVLVVHHIDLTTSTTTRVVQPVKVKTAPKAVVVLPKIQHYLSTSYYHTSCPNLEAIIHNKITAWIKRDYTMAASLIRLHFHDCAVRGCDGSILLNHGGSERRAEVSKTLRGFQVIDDIKAEVEKRCPKTVSCADILTAAARDATVIAGGPFWEVPFGRKDGRISLAKEAQALVPQGRENITSLIHFFQAGLGGLDVLDMVVLSGSHTIGRSSCSSVRQNRLLLTTTKNSIDPYFLSSLKRKCRSSSSHYFVDLDATTPRTFDAIYYTNLQKKKGLLSTDQLLYSDARTAPFVDALASQPELFNNQFAVSMIKLGNNVQLLAQGEIRLNCNYVNS